MVNTFYPWIMNKNLTKNNNEVLLILYQNNGKRELVLYTVPHMCLCVFIDKIFLQIMPKTFHHILLLVSIAAWSRWCYCQRNRTGCVFLSISSSLLLKMQITWSLQDTNLLRCQMIYSHPVIVQNLADVVFGGYL